MRVDPCFASAPGGEASTETAAGLRLPLLDLVFARIARLVLAGEARPPQPGSPTILLNILGCRQAVRLSRTQTPAQGRPRTLGQEGYIKCVIGNMCVGIRKVDAAAGADVSRNAC